MPTKLTDVTGNILNSPNINIRNVGQIKTENKVKNLNGRCGGHYNKVKLDGNGKAANIFPLISLYLIL